MSNEERLAVVFRNRETAGPASEDQIRRVEDGLQVRLPPSYKVFLRTYGAAWLDAPYEIAGIRPDPEPGHSPLYGDVLTSNLAVRRNDRLGFFRSYVLITTDGGECYFYLDTARARSDEECPVVVIAPGMDTVEIAPTFLDFVEKAAQHDPLDGIV